LAADEKPRALLLAPESPYPLAGGGALRTASILHYLAQRYAVDLLVFRQPHAPNPEASLPPGLVCRICAIDLPENGRSGAARAFRNMARLIRRVPPLVDRFSGFERQIEQAIALRRYELGIVEHLWCASYIDALSKACARTVLDLHNIESVLHERCAAAESKPLSFAHRRFGRASLELERTWLPRFSEILTPSLEDAALAQARAPNTRVTVYPNAIPLPPLPSIAAEHAIVFSGNLEYHPNITAVRFFRHEVWPLLRERWPNLRWRLIGKNPEAVRQWTAGDPRIECSGAVPDAITALASAQVAVVPLLSGSGTRLKILEAWGAAVPVVSTSLGAEGLAARDGEHLLLADQPGAFAEAVSRLLESPPHRESVGRAGRQLLETRFSWEKVWRNLDL
jgi:glycosyltransferase involved in cell wall biosynthesis